MHQNKCTSQIFEHRTTRHWESTFQICFSVNNFLCTVKQNDINIVQQSESVEEGSEYADFITLSHKSEWILMKNSSVKAIYWATMDELSKVMGLHSSSDYTVAYIEDLN